jgi:hypothetical protein
MGITGTEVSKEAAVMILTDDNFATIVGAVEYGRTLYDNLLKYLRFQMSTLVAFIAVFLAAGHPEHRGRCAAHPLQILWLNMIVDIPIAIALGFDDASPGLMARTAPAGRLAGAVPANWVRLCLQGAVMTPGALVAYEIGDNRYDAVVASTMLLTTLSLFHLAPGSWPATSATRSSTATPSPARCSCGATRWRCWRSSRSPRSASSSGSPAPPSCGSRCGACARAWRPRWWWSRSWSSSSSAGVRSPPSATDETRAPRGWRRARATRVASAADPRHVLTSQPATRAQGVRSPWPSTSATGAT